MILRDNKKGEWKKSVIKKKKQRKEEERWTKAGFRFEWGKEGVFIGVGAYRRFRGALSAAMWVLKKMPLLRRFF